MREKKMEIIRNYGGKFLRYKNDPNRMEKGKKGEDNKWGGKQQKNRSGFEVPAYICQRPLSELIPAVNPSKAALSFGVKMIGMF